MTLGSPSGTAAIASAIDRRRFLSHAPFQSKYVFNLTRESRLKILQMLGSSSQ